MTLRGLFQCLSLGETSTLGEQTATKCFREMLANFDFCSMSQKAITTICQWCQITIILYIIRLYRQPRLFCETSAEITNYVIVFCETTRNLGPQKLNFDVSLIVVGGSSLCTFIDLVYRMDVSYSLSYSYLSCHLPFITK